MNKTELINAVAEKGLTKKDATIAVNGVFDTIIAELAKGEKVQLIGFGTFEVRERAERQGKNPQTGEKMVIPACKSPAFKAGTPFKAALK